MQPIEPAAVQSALSGFAGKDVYLHMEMTTGAYASHLDSSKLTASTYIRNGLIRFLHGKIEGHGPYRIGLKMQHGWVQTEGLTHWELDDAQRLIMAGHDGEGRLVVGLQLSLKPF